MTVASNRSQPAANAEPAPVTLPPWVGLQASHAVDFPGGPAERLVFGALIAHAAPRDHAWPSITRVVLETGLSRSSVIRALANLVASGLVAKKATTGRHNMYVLAVEMVIALSSTWTSVTQTPVSHRHRLNGKSVVNLLGTGVRETRVPVSHGHHTSVTLTPEVSTGSTQAEATQDTKDFPTPLRGVGTVTSSAAVPTIASIAEMIRQGSEGLSYADRAACLSLARRFERNLNSRLCARKLDEIATRVGISRDLFPSSTHLVVAAREERGRRLDLELGLATSAPRVEVRT